MKDKKLFKSTPGSSITATLWHGRHYGLQTIGYKRAADLLVQHIIETKITLDINTLVFPILYLYRHYIEIKLKDIVRTGYQAFRIDKKVPTKHELNSLWNKVNELRIKAKIEIDKKQKKLVFLYMDELSKVDPTSESFRYPTTTQDESALPDNMIYIDLKHFAEEINTVSQVIEYIDNMMIAQLERKEEFESEYYGEY